MLRIFVCLTIVLVVYSHCVAGVDFPCAPVVGDIECYVPAKSDPEFAVVPIAFAGSNPDSIYLNDRHYDLFEDFAEFLRRQSNQNYTVRPILRPQDGENKSMWVLSNYADDYKSYAWCVDPMIA